MKAIRHIEFLKLDFCQAYRVREANLHQQTKFIKIGQMIFEISRLFDFQDGGHLPSWILEMLNILLADKVQRPEMHHCIRFCQN